MIFVHFFFFFDSQKCCFHDFSVFFGKFTTLVVYILKDYDKNDKSTHKV